MYRLFFAIALLGCGSLFAQPGAKTGQPGEPSPTPPQVDTAEVLRRGDMVVVAGEGPRGADEDAMRMATAPPADESAMWFVTVIKTNNCTYCTKLHSDFQSAPELLAFVAAASPYKPWGHYNEYNVNDETQKWRIKAYKISGYPTLVIQPPRNGMWGNPRTVVYQTTGYDGNPKKLAASITSGVRKYAAKMSEQGYPKMMQLDTPESKQSYRDAQLKTPLWGNNRTPVKTQTIASSFNLPIVEGGAKAQAEQLILPGGILNPQTWQVAQYTPEPSAPAEERSHLDQPAGRGQYTPAYQPQMGTNPPFNSPPKVDPFNPQPLSPNSPPVSPNGPLPSQWPPSDNPQPTTPTLPGIGVLMSLFLQMIGSFLTGSGLTNLLLLGIAGFHLLKTIAPQTVTLDDKALTILQRLVPSGTTLTKPAPADPSTTIQK